jgi:glucokinase
MKLLATDIGGSHAQCALVEDDRVLIQKRTEIPVGCGLSAALVLIGESFREFLQKSGLINGDVQGIVISFCGLVDPVRRRVLASNAKYGDAATIDLEGWARDGFQLPLRIENDARLALLGERHAGAARGVNDLVTMTLGTGVGGAAMINGQLIRGKHSQAGCLGGHLLARYRGRVCTCGNVGCVEAEASTWALPAICLEHPRFKLSVLAHEKVLDIATVCRCAEAGDDCAQEILDHCAGIWSAGIVSLIHAYDPEVAVVGGGAMRSARILLPKFVNYVHQHAWTPWGKVDVRAAALGDQASLLGAVPLWEDLTL